MSATIEGLNKNFDAIVGTAIAFTIAATATTVMRIVSKRIKHTPFKFEDHTAFLALAMYIVTEGLLIKCVIVGRHAKDQNDKYGQLNTEYAYIYSALYFAIIALCIASVSLFYRRIFIKRHIRFLTTAVLLIDLGWWISSTIVEITFPASLPATFPGNPQQAQFKVSYLAWWFAAGIIEIFIVVITTLIPLREIRHLHMNLRKKILLGLAFSVSYLCVGTGIARLATLYRPGAQHFDASIGDIWINTHLSSAIMSANLPLCWPIFSHLEGTLSSMTTRRAWTRSSNSRMTGSNTGSRRSSSGGMRQLEQILSGSTEVSNTIGTARKADVRSKSRPIETDLEIGHQAPKEQDLGEKSRQSSEETKVCLEEIEDGSLKILQPPQAVHLDLVRRDG